MSLYLRTEYTFFFYPLWAGKCRSRVWTWVRRLWWLGRGWHSWSLQHSSEEEDPWRGLSINGSCCGGSRSCIVEWTMMYSTMRLVPILCLSTVQMHSRFQLKKQCILSNWCYESGKVTIPSSLYWYWGYHCWRSEFKMICSLLAVKVYITK